MVVLTDARDSSMADRAAGYFFASHRGELRGGATLVRRAVAGRFGFALLHAARDSYLKNAPPKNVASVDVDERRNRVVIGVMNEDTTAVVRHVKSIGLPREVFIVERDNPPPPLSLFIDAQRPVVAGLGIIFFGSSGGLNQCSLAWNVYRRNGAVVDSSVRYFMTASHCSTTFGVGSLESTSFYQGVPGLSSDSLGKESFDPAPFTGGTCPSGWQCRYSDAQLGRYSASILWRHGGAAVGNFAPPPAFPTYSFYVTAPTGGIAQSSFWAVGSMSGSKGGGVLKKTCYDRAWAPMPHNIWMKCQYQVDLPAYQGDSGGIIYYPEQYWPAVVPVGLRWAGDLVNGGRSDFSPIGGIEQDLGQLQFLTSCWTLCFGTYN